MKYKIIHAKISSIGLKSHLLVKDKPFLLLYCIINMSIKWCTVSMADSPTLTSPRILSSLSGSGQPSKKDFVMAILWWTWNCKFVILDARKTNFIEQPFLLPKWKKKHHWLKQEIVLYKDNARLYHPPFQMNSFPVLRQNYYSNF